MEDGDGGANEEEAVGDFRFLVFDFGLKYIHRRDKEIRGGFAESAWEGLYNFTTKNTKALHKVHEGLLNVENIVLFVLYFL